MASRASSASDGEVFENQHKAKTINQPSESTINDSDRVPFGLDGASDTYSRNHRAFDRSPSPFRRNRPRSRSPLPYRHSRPNDRSPSPYRSTRDSRSYEGNHNKRKASPQRGGRSDKRHHTDRSTYNDRDRRNWDRTDDARAPPHAASHFKSAKEGQRPKPISYAELENPNTVPKFNGEHKRTSNGPQSQPRTSIEVATPTTSANGDVEMKSAQDEDQRDYTLEPVEDKVPTPESREERKRRWAARRAAEKAKENLLQQALLTNASESTTPNIASPATRAENSMSPSASPRVEHLDSGPASPDVMILDKQQDVISEGNSPSAAEYDPTKDMLEDRNRAALKAQQSELPSDAYNETDPKVLSTLPAEKVLPVKKQKKELDMFASDDEYEEAAEEEDDAATKGTVLDAKLLDNWDDKDGYYKLINHELVNSGRYRMIKTLGRGVFANVAQAEDTQAHGNDNKRKLVAIKIVRRNDLMRKASQKEMEFLRRANEEDPQDKRHIIRVLTSFDHKGHFCMVFEHMSMNLRDLLKEVGSGHGLALEAVRKYALQMFSALKHLQGCQIIHLDLKPDNILVSMDKKVVKLCDFGTAEDRRDNVEFSDYLVSRFYRAPEIILKMKIGHGVDMWAIGCTLYELWTGKILFTGRSNNQMIKAFIDCLGWPSEKLLKKGDLKSVLAHFEAGPPMQFISLELNQYNQPYTRKIEQPKKIARDLRTRVHDGAKDISQGRPTTSDLNDFADLLSATLNLNPEKRIQPKDALEHKFFTKSSVNKAFTSKPAMYKTPMMKPGTSGIRR